MIWFINYEDFPFQLLSSIVRLPIVYYVSVTQQIWICIRINIINNNARENSNLNHMSFHVNITLVRYNESVNIPRCNPNHTPKHSQSHSHHIQIYQDS
jgi:hypothetical protein